MTPHKAIEALKALKPGDRWEIEMTLVHAMNGSESEDWTIMRKEYPALTRQYWEGPTLDEAMERVLESLNVPSSFGSK